ncbi:hypothetical protein PCASD_02292 [Puccinia coronata f. sp. avenae]|uniref:Uncharacterized protein n=1 Tax=Puccinia coronata f. sp. avenae TaxID=200324 RepID=A0A2N5VB77_9BASI|nr:hypothetical protein PCASD_02292 [Puccinia coronata f. sp. avenae]
MSLVDQISMNALSRCYSAKNELLNRHPFETDLHLPHLPLSIFGGFFQLFPTNYMMPFARRVFVLLQMATLISAIPVEGVTGSSSKSLGQLREEFSPWKNQLNAFGSAPNSKSAPLNNQAENSVGPISLPQETLQRCNICSESGSAVTGKLGTTCSHPTQIIEDNDAEDEMKVLKNRFFGQTVWYYSLGTLRNNESGHCKRPDLGIEDSLNHLEQKFAFHDERLCCLERLASAPEIVVRASLSVRLT